MSLNKKLERIDRKSKNGLKLKSADRLRNLINEHPNEMMIWKKLVELYYDSGFLDAAGRYWVLTEPTDERIQKAQEIYLESVNYSGTKILNDITFRGNKEDLPTYAEQRLSELENDSYSKSKYVPQFNPKVSKNEQQKLNKSKQSNSSIALVIFITCILALVSFTVIGIISTINWLF